MKDARVVVRHMYNRGMDRVARRPHPFLYFVGYTAASSQKVCSQLTAIELYYNNSFILSCNIIYHTYT